MNSTTIKDNGQNRAKVAKQLIKYLPAKFQEDANAASKVVASGKIAHFWDWDDSFMHALYEMQEEQERTLSAPTREMIAMEYVKWVLDWTFGFGKVTVSEIESKLGIKIDL